MHAKVSLRIDVVVPVLNKVRYLRTSLASILSAAETAGDVDVVVIDHGSSDGSRELAASLCEGRANVIERASGTIGALRNAGSRLGSAPVISFIDGDCVLPLDYFQNLRSVLGQHAVDATGCRVDYPVDGPWVERVWHELHRAKEGDGPRSYINSGNFAVRREAFELVGGFDEGLVTGEDTELGQRLAASGFVVWEARSLAVCHIDNPKTLTEFWRKEVWHGLGMYSSGRLWPPSRVLAMTLLHFAALCFSVWIIFLGQGPLAWRLALAIALLFLAPFCAVVYRVLSLRRSVALLPSIALYQVYLVARIMAGVVVLQRLRNSSANACD